MVPENIFNSERICVVVPTYNNCATLPDVLHRIMKITDNVVVVNDGSTDCTHEILQRAAYSALEIVSYGENRGKGHALKCGFKRALECGYDYAITIDSDGQHYPEDIPLVLDAFSANKGSFVVGVRSFGDENMPGSNLFANRFSNFWFRLQTGENLSDTQCGFRMYPLKRISLYWPITSRYESELEFLVYSSWRGIPIVPVKVNVYYPPAEERVSHFRPFHDFFRITVLNTVLCVAMLFFMPRRIVRNIRRRVAERRS